MFKRLLIGYSLNITGNQSGASISAIFANWKILDAQ